MHTDKSGPSHVELLQINGSAWLSILPQILRQLFIPNRCQVGACWVWNPLNRACARPFIVRDSRLWEILTRHLLPLLQLIENTLACRTARRLNHHFIRHQHLVHMGGCVRTNLPSPVFNEPGSTKTGLGWAVRSLRQTVQSLPSTAHRQKCGGSIGLPCCQRICF
jgi:hypothetical protein